MFNDVYISMIVFDKTFFLRYNNIEFHIYVKIELLKKIASTPLHCKRDYNTNNKIKINFKIM